MRRRKIIKLISLSTLGLGSLVYFSTERWFLSILASIRPHDQNTLEKIAFVETIYPYFSRETLMKEAETILSKRNSWNTIDNTFFFSLSSKSKKPFHKYPLHERERLIAQYIDESSIRDKISLDKFTKARVNIMISLVNKSFSPFKAYGYPEQRVLPFTADPSWDEYHIKPGSREGGWLDI